MAGTLEGGKKAAARNKELYGADFYKTLGRLGGKKSRNGGFSSLRVGQDGLTGQQRARVAGKKGGYTSTRGPKVEVMAVENKKRFIFFEEL